MQVAEELLGLGPDEISDADRQNRTRRSVRACRHRGAGGSAHHRDRERRRSEHGSPELRPRMHQIAPLLYRPASMAGARRATHEDRLVSGQVVHHETSIVCSSADGLQEARRLGVLSGSSLIAGQSGSGRQGSGLAPRPLLPPNPPITPETGLMRLAASTVLTRARQEPLRGRHRCRTAPRREDDLVQPS